MQRLDAAPPMPLSDALADWRSLLPGIAIWALALYVPQGRWLLAAAKWFWCSAA